MNRSQELSRALAEIFRIECIVHRLDPPAGTAAAWRALHDEPPPRSPTWTVRALAQLTGRRQERSYGVTWTLRRSFIYVTAPVPFFAVQMPNVVAVTFDGSARPDLAPAVRRFAAERIFTAKGWRFPVELASPEVFGAVQDLIWAGQPRFRFDRLPERAAGIEGSLELEGTWTADNLRERVAVCWSPDRLFMRSPRYGEV